MSHKLAKSKIIVFVVLLLLMMLSMYFQDWLTIGNIKQNKASIQRLIDDHYGYSVVLFYLSCVIFVNLPVPLAALIKVLGGYFFGLYLGIFYNITATILACIVGFAISRFFFKDAFEARYYQKLESIENDIERNGFYYFLLLRLVMVMPYFVINVLAGISRISFKDYLFSSCLGVIPASVIYANGGNQLEKIDSIDELFNPELVVSFVLIGLFLMIPVLRKSRAQ